MNSLSASLIAVAMGLLASTNALAAAPAAYETAAFVDYGSAEPGGYFLDDTRSIGAAFQISQAIDVTAIGAYFTQYSTDSIFGAIVPLASLSALPTGSIDSVALAHVVFAPTGTDQSELLSVHLDPGAYAVVFGSGLWGATGTSALVSGQDGAGSTLFAGAGSSWASLDASDVRLAVYGNVSPVPEPSSWALMLAGFAGLGFSLRRRSDLR